ncbi:MAG: 2-amino-4-hydroxy-6-hydroxymethyldihydropteridine diphosphokinase [Candidatus Hydrogenedentes bacterium]|nr:2-amino-4-hydroxy-6-hydroxymethyldihydropteridine diphosphokinase [Candidatus Hydrogenedentota bacterium]
MPKAFISVGSNIHPETNILDAVSMLARAVTLRSVSTFYHTAPVNRPGQPAFVNGMCEVETDLDPQVLKTQVLHPIEAKLGRNRVTDKYAPRTIDLDVVLYDDVVLRTPELRLPDPDLRARAFLAKTLLELAPDTVLPDTGERLAEVLTNCDRHDMIPLPEFTEQVKERLA